MAYKTEFAEGVRAALAGRPYRQIAARVRGVEISPSYIADMVQGRVPKREMVIAFADACQLDEPATNELLAAGGYAPMEPVEESGAEFFVRELARLKAKYGRPIPVDLEGGLEGELLTMRRARKVIANLETQLEEETI